ncbi:hypothetical protein ACIA8K_27605 [Catenuloplanes sp. NPDC051500]|uniref:hypothetical protein n=1 Tax=Catenuloplanes sp. NPDC051500 TaxID=3363959 RepID=UPI0037A0CB6A
MESVVMDVGVIDWTVESNRCMAGSLIVLRGPSLGCGPLWDRATDAAIVLTDLLFHVDVITGDKLRV